MALVTLKPILEDAKRRGYAVGSFNMLGIETVRGTIKAAEELNSPVILQLAEVHTPFAPIEYMAPVMIEAAKKAKVPVVVHFDHGTSYDSIVNAIRHGFSSIMFDGASNAFEENVKLTKEIVRLAHAMGVSAEAELGQVGGTEDGHGDVMATLTDVKEAKIFVQETKVDALAVSIGNLHGAYVEPPKLHFDRLREISQTIDTPLVLHGGSGTGIEGFKRCIKNGICKVNIATAIHQEAVNGVRNHVDRSVRKTNYFSVMNSIIEGTYAGVKNHINIFGSNGKAERSSTEQLVCEVVKQVLNSMRVG